MRKENLDRVVERLTVPMAEFVREARVRTAILLSHSGQVLAQHGFFRRYDINNVAALAAAAHVSSHALAELIGAGRWVHLHHVGQENQLFLAPFECDGEEFVLVTIFDSESTLGLVQLFFDRLVDSVREIPHLWKAAPTDVAAFERDLEAGLERILSDRDD